jgi:hypothetical protein
MKHGQVFNDNFPSVFRFLASLVMTTYRIIHDKLYVWLKKFFAKYIQNLSYTLAFQFCKSIIALFQF